MKKLLAAALILGWVSPSLAQGMDPMLTMYTYQPLNINPALCGTSDAKWRMNSIHKERAAATSRPYRQTQGFIDFNLPINAWTGNIWGLGLNIVDEDAGDSRMRNRRFNLNMALGQYLDARQVHSISVGFQAGLGMRGIDYSDVYWNSQWAEEGFRLKQDPGENLDQTVRGYFDLSTGVQYTYYSGELMEFYGGASVYHVNRPDISLLNDTGSFNMSRRVTLHGELVHRIRDNSHFATRPMVLYTRQYDRGVLLAGNTFQFFFTEGTRTTGKRNETSMSLGLFARAALTTPNSLNPASKNNLTDVLGTIAFDFAGFTFGAGYDIPLGSFQTVNGFEGGFEFMIGYRAGHSRGLYNKYAPKKKGRL